MNTNKLVMIALMMFCLIVPIIVVAAEDESEASIDETPSFTNPAQAQHAANISEATFSEQDANEATSNANDIADAEAKDAAYQEVKQLSRDYALSSVNTEDYPNLDERATYYADKLVDEKAKEYAESLGFAEGNPDYEEAYNKAVERLTGSSFHNAWDTAYEEAISKALDAEDFSSWKEAFNSAYERATAGGENWEDAWHTAYNKAYELAYEKALTDEVSRITGLKLQEIHRLRYEEKLGWGQIKQLYNAPKGVLGLGHTYKAQINIPEVQTTPPDQEVLSLNAEITEATKRNFKTGWASETAVSQKGNKKNKNPQKYYGLTQTSGVTDDVEAISAETLSSSSNTGKSNKNNAGVGNSSKTSKSNSDNANKSNNGKSGKSNNGNSSSNKSGGNSGNNGNKGGNGKN